MGITHHAGFGYGFSLNQTQQTQLSEFLLQHFKTLPENHPFRDSFWFTDELDNLYLEDALEELYEGTLTVTGTEINNEYHVILLAKSTVTEGYNHGVEFAQVGLSFVPNPAEREVLQLFRQHLSTSARWLLFIG